MSSPKRSNLPNVLTEYAPESKSNNSSHQTSQTKQDGDATTAAASKAGNPTKSGTGSHKTRGGETSHQQRRNTVVNKKGHENGSSGGGGGVNRHEDDRGQATTKDRRESMRRQSSVRQEQHQQNSTRKASLKTSKSSAEDLSSGDGEQVTGKQKAKKYERTFENWQMIKEEAKEEELERLNNKITLQKELIRAQDSLRDERKQQEEEERIKKREADRNARQAQTEERRQICRESLESDRAKLAQRRARHDKKKQEAGSTAVSTSRSHDHHPAAAPGPSRLPRQFTEVSQHSSLNSGPLQHPASPDEELLDPHDVIDDVIREEEESVGDEEEEDIEEELPWHHQQLYDLYGRRQADYFLHPKIETIKKRDVKPLNPSMRRVGGHAGAGALWTVLRNDSRMKILREDTKLISPELKGAYSAFARELLQKRRKRPVKRNFYSTEDVPEIERLLDLSRLHGAHDYRHKVELMLRSSHINEERTAVLAFNNPPPDLNNATGQESISRYLPSWVPDDWDQESGVSYKKWLVRAGPQGDSPSPRSDTTREPPSPSPQQYQLVPIGVSPASRDTTTPPPSKTNDYQGKLTFLTEKDTTVPGQFAQRQKELLAQRNLPQAHQGSLSAPPGGSTEHGGGDSSNKVHQSGGEGDHTRSSSVKLPHWAPLSMSALMEYSSRRQTVGEGPFSGGKTPTWHVEGAVA